MAKRIEVLVVVVCLFLALLSPARAQVKENIFVNDSWVQIDFPLQLHLGARIHSPVEITDIRVRYMVQREGFAKVISEGRVDFKRANMVEAKWSLDMRRIGGLPAGTYINYWWLVRNAEGEVFETEPVLFQITDARYRWRQLAEGQINIFWYHGDDNFARTLMETAQEALSKLAQDTGAKPDKDIEIYIYASATDLRGSLIFPQEWAGGVAYTRLNIIAIGIAPSNLAWGKRAMAHELAHIVMYQMTNNPYNSPPVWLDEGLAMYAEGPLLPQYANPLIEAVRSDSLITVRSLASPFSTDTAKSLLSYAHSFSLIEFLTKQYGPEKMMELLYSFQQGNTYDGVLLDIYGFDMDGLDLLWRNWVKNLYR